MLPELLIDVANYAHVPKGPGVVLIGHGSDYFMDEGEGRLGLLYNRKRAGRRPASAWRTPSAARCTPAQLLETDPALAGKLKFAHRRAAVPDQRPPARAQHRRDLRRRCAPSWRRWPRRSTARPASSARVGDAKAAVRACASRRRPAPPLATLLDRAGGPPAS